MLLKVRGYIALNVNPKIAEPNIAEAPGRPIKRSRQLHIHTIMQL